MKNTNAMLAVTHTESGNGVQMTSYTSLNTESHLGSSYVCLLGLR